MIFIKLTVAHLVQVHIAPGPNRNYDKRHRRFAMAEVRLHEPSHAQTYQLPSQKKENKKVRENDNVQDVQDA